MTPDRDGQEENPIRTDLRNRYMAVQSRVVEIGATGETIGEEEAVRLAFMWSYLGSVEFSTHVREMPNDPYDDLEADGLSAREAVINAQHGEYGGLKLWLDDVSGGFKATVFAAFFTGETLSPEGEAHILAMAAGLDKISNALPASGIPLHPGMFPAD